MGITIETLPRQDPPGWFKICIILLSLFTGLCAIGIVFLVKGVNPLYAIYKIFAGSFGSVYGIKETITKAIPLILIAGGLTLVFRAKFWNIGAEGQLVLGAAAATWIGLAIGPVMPAWITLPLMILAGFIAGAIWALIPALLKVRFTINEVISTLMLNYVAAEIIKFLVVGPWKGSTKFGFPYTDNIPASAVLDVIPGSRIHYITLIIALAAVVILFFLMFKTRTGYEVRVIGESREAARYAGINYVKSIIIIMCISGGVAGLAGAGEIAGIHHQLTYPDQISAGYGFTAIIVAWLAKLNPLFVIIAGIFFAGILVGGDAIQISLGLPAATVGIFNGIILFFLIMGEFFMNNRIRLKRN
ncbi:MAG: ABC transporter permease [Spirochaetales bacterium]|nr:ABC transporter permease [Spirochaetales bacterium]